MRVLVVDDDHAVADSLAAILEILGHTSSVAYNADHALAIAAEAQPQALITDVMMHGMNGIELSQQFTQLYPNCRVLLTSGNQKTAELLQESERYGFAYPILAKPYHPSEIIRFLAGDSSAPEQTAASASLFPE